MNHVIRAVPLRLHGASGVRYAGKCLPILLDTSVFKVPLWGSSSGHSCRHRPRRATAFLSETQVDEGCHAGTPVLQLTFSLRSESKQVTTCRRQSQTQPNYLPLCFRMHCHHYHFQGITPRAQGETGNTGGSAVQLGCFSGFVLLSTVKKNTDQTSSVCESITASKFGI